MISSAGACTKLEQNTNIKPDVSSIPIIDISDTTLNFIGIKYDANLADIPKSPETDKRRDIAQKYSAKDIEHKQNDPVSSNNIKANVESILTAQKDATLNISLNG